MASLDSIVRVSIVRETNFPTVQDLQTMLILTQDVPVGFTTLTAEYSSLDELAAAGFTTTSFAYKAAQSVFSQTYQPAKIIVGKRTSTDTAVVTDLQAVIAENNNWLYLITDVETAANIELLAAYIETTKKFYVFSYGVSTIASPAVAFTDVTTLFGALQTAKYFNTFYLFSNQSWVSTGTTVPEAAWVGLFGSQQTGSTIWIFKPLVGIPFDNLSTTQTTALEAVNASYIVPVEGSGVVAGTNKVAGGEYIDVMTGVRWIETRMPEAIWNTLLNVSKLNYDSAGVAQIEANIRSVLSEAIGFNIIAAQPAPIITVPNVLNLTPAQRNTRNVDGITFRARLAGAIQKVDGIIGTVFP